MVQYTRVGFKLSSVQMWQTKSLLWQDWPVQFEAVEGVREEVDELLSLVEDALDAFAGRQVDGGAPSGPGLEVVEDGHPELDHLAENQWEELLFVCYENEMVSVYHEVARVTEGHAWLEMAPNDK